MNEKETKLSEDLNEWEGIDIYLFTNGQQFSPPRKYHLKSQQLASWRPLLNYLARAQYGYTHSNIDLYTLEGEKVSGPLQLVHGVSYVAVEPNDPFIYTGYEQYLMKASSYPAYGLLEHGVSNTATPQELPRDHMQQHNNPLGNCYLAAVFCNVSWLKRYGLGGTIKSDDTAEIKMLSRISTNVENVHEQSTTKTRANTGQPNCEPSNKEQENIKANPEPISKARGQTRNNVTGVKSIQQRKQSIVHRNSVSKKTIPMTVATPRNAYFKKRDSPTKENLKRVPTMYGRASIKPVNFNKTQVRKTNTTSKALVRAEELTPEFVVPVKFNKSLKGSTSEVKINQNKDVSNSYNDTEAVLKLDNSGTNTNITAFPSNIVKTSLEVQKEGSLTPIYVPYDEVYKIDDVNNKTINGEVRLPFINIGNKINRQQLSIENKDTSHSDSKIQNVSKLASNTTQNICNKPTINSFTALANHGHVIKLKISIEVKNDSDTVAIENEQCKNMEESKLCNVNTLNSLHNKETQVNFDEMHVPQIPLQTFVNSSYQTDQKAILIYCNCSNINNSSVACKMHIVNAVVIKNDDEESEVIVKLSHLQHTVNLAGFSCDDTIPKVDKQVQTSKTIQETDALDHANVCDSFSGESLPFVTIPDAENSPMKQNKTAHSHELRNQKQESISKIDTNCTKFPLTQNNHLNTSLKLLVNKHTQTDIHNLLLEARRQEDSRYSFHLPPIRVLKCYNLC